jgi:hypothetical protein
MRLAVPLAVLALAAPLLAGCGGSSSDEGPPSGASTPAQKQPAADAGSAGAPVGATARSCETGAGAAESLRATGVSCNRARRVLYDWERASACGDPSGTSRSGCSVHSYRCIGARTDRGVAVSCARPGYSVAFLTKPR